MVNVHVVDSQILFEYHATHFLDIKPPIVPFPIVYLDMYGRTQWRLFVDQSTSDRIKDPDGRCFLHQSMQQKHGNPL